MLAIIAAFQEEVKGYVKARGFRVTGREGPLRCYESRSSTEVVVIDGAVGREAASAAAEMAIDRYRPNLVISAGFAGGVKEGQSTGDVFLCDRLLAIEGPVMFWQPDSAMERPSRQIVSLEGLVGANVGEGDSYRVSGCLSVPDLLQSSSTKRWIGDTFPVDIIDMESYWVGEAAAERGIPHAAVRTVLDPVDQTLPPFVGKAVRDRGLRGWRALRHVPTRPADVPRLLQLRRQVKRARESLGAILETLDAGLEGSRRGP